jgi:TM2 domain-containing membrane protein YozV
MTVGKLIIGSVVSLIAIIFCGILGYFEFQWGQVIWGIVMAVCVLINLGCIAWNISTYIKVVGRKSERYDIK